MLRGRVDEAAEPYRVVGHPHPGRLADQHFIENARQAVNVGPFVEIGTSRRLFRAHISRRTNGETGAREMLNTGGTDRLRDAKVCHNGVALGQEDVLWLDVAVDDAHAMRVTQRIRDFLHDLRGARHVEASFAQQ